MKRFPLFLAVLFGGLMLLGADGCSSDPNVEGAKLDLRNKDYDRALENLDKALEKDPNNAEALMLRGQVLEEKAFAANEPGEHSRLLEEMMMAYDKAKAADPEMAADINNRLKIAYFNEFQRGVQAFNRGQNAEDGATEFNAAAQYFGNAGMMMPDSTGPHVNQAFALINAGRTDAAIEPFEKAINKGEPSVDIYVYLADLYRSEERYDDAIGVLEKASKMHPDDANVQTQLLNLYVLSGKADEALAAYQREIDRDPQNKLYRYNYGSLLLETDDYDGAIEHLSVAVELDPEYANAQYNLGAAYVNKAVAVNEEMSAIDDDLRANKSSMSADQVKEMEMKMENMAEERKGLFEKAITPLEKAKSLTENEGGDASAICQALFSAYVQTGNQDKAQSISECAGYDLN